MTSLMPETIEPATGGSAGGPGGTLPLPKAKKARVSWTQSQVAALVQAYAEGPVVSVGEHGTDECAAKLIELGIIPKPEKVTLTRAVQVQADHALAYFEDMPEGQRTLAIRYAIKALTALLPKRASK